MITSRLVFTGYNFGNGERGGATIKRFYLFGYLVAWRTVDTWAERPAPAMPFCAPALDEISGQLRRATDVREETTRVIEDADHYVPAKPSFLNDL